MCVVMVLFECLKFVLFFGGLRRKQGKNYVNFSLVVFLRKLLVVVEWVSGSIIFY